MLKIRRPLGRLIFNMGIAIPGKTVFLIETAPWVYVFLALAQWYMVYTQTWSFVYHSDLCDNFHAISKLYPYNYNFTPSVYFKPTFCMFLPEASFGLRVLSLPASVCVCVCLSVCQSRVCPRDNSSSQNHQIWSTDAKHLGWGPYCFVGWSTLTFKVKFNLKVEFYVILSLSGR